MPAPAANLKALAVAGCAAGRSARPWVLARRSPACLRADVPLGVRWWAVTAAATVTKAPSRRAASTTAASSTAPDAGRRTHEMLAEARALLDRSGAVREEDAQRAVDMLKECAEVRGDANALVVLAKIYEHGLAGCEADASRALDLYRRAAAQGSAEAQYRGARLVFSGALEEAGAGGPGGAAAGGTEMEVARVDDGRVMLLPKEGTSTSCGQTEEIAKLLKPKRGPGAERPRSESRARPLREEAARWLAASAEAGNADALVLAANLRVSGSGAPEVPADAPRALEMYEAAAARGHGDALFNLGTLFWEGGPAVPADRRRALAYFQRAAANGDASAAFFLSTLYHAGGPDGVPPRDIERALSYLDVAVAQEHPGAIHYLALMHRVGDGVPQDLGRMRRLLERAVRAGSPEAAHCLADMHAAGSDGVEPDRRAARPSRHDSRLAWLLRGWPAAGRRLDGPLARPASGHVAALRNLAHLFAGGAGVPRNDELAARLLAIAAGIEKRAAEGPGGPAPGTAA
eukprot:tig00020801_g13966.t1